MSKLHFVFIMLSISQIHILREGKIIGVITKYEFFEKKKAMVEEEEEEIN